MLDPCLITHPRSLGQIGKKLPFILTNCHHSFGSLSVAILVDFFPFFALSSKSYKSRKKVRE
ncbi:hypothetical protein TMatcc_004161 [Talaromyces marneffei ATCC 18224]